MSKRTNDEISTIDITKEFLDFSDSKATHPSDVELIFDNGKLYVNAFILKRKFKFFESLLLDAWNSTIPNKDQRREFLMAPQSNNYCESIIPFLHHAYGDDIATKSSIQDLFKTIGERLPNVKQSSFEQFLTFLSKAEAPSMLKILHASIQTNTILYPDMYSILKKWSKYGKLPALVLNGISLEYSYFICINKGSAKLFIDMFKGKTDTDDVEFYINTFCIQPASHNQKTDYLKILLLFDRQSLLDSGEKLQLNLWSRDQIIVAANWANVYSNEQLTRKLFSYVASLINNDTESSFGSKPKTPVLGFPGLY